MLSVLNLELINGFIELIYLINFLELLDPTSSYTKSNANVCILIMERKFQKRNQKHSIFNCLVAIDVVVSYPSGRIVSATGRVYAGLGKHGSRRCYKRRLVCARGSRTRDCQGFTWKIFISSHTISGQVSFG